MPISRSARPVLAITLGDPAGIGPEVTLKALARCSGGLSADVLLCGPPSHYAALAERLGLRLTFDSSPVPRPIGRRISCFHPEPFPAAVRPGRQSRALTRASVVSIDRAAGLARAGLADGIVTAPIHKAGLRRAGFRIPGHTEYLARLAGVRRFEMMLTGGPLRVVLVTRHDPIGRVPAILTRRRVTEAIRMTAAELRGRFGIRRPRIGVCGLNPHAGEEGHIGREELRVIRPAVASARRGLGAVLEGPLPADALFVEAYRGRYDAEICMYHDQGLIPLKMISRGGGVNVTLGLPYVRTSPDHGTAYDIAGSGTADSGSMEQAIRTAARLCRTTTRAGSGR